MLRNRAAAIDYILVGDLDVNAKLTIEPGVVIVTKAGTGIKFNSSPGCLVAILNATAPIIIRSETNSKGGWKGLRFSGSNNPLTELVYVTVSDGGSASFNGDNTEKANIRLASTTQIKMRNCTINNSAAFGIYEEEFDDLTITDFKNNFFSNNSDLPIYIRDKNIASLETTSTFSNNTKNYIAMVQDNFNGLTGDVIWYKQAVPYLFNDPAGLTLGYLSTNGGLTLEAGATLLMAAGSRIFVGDNSNTSGYLKINGTASEPVTIGGVDGLKGGWNGIVISTTSIKNVWNYANISDGGAVEPYGAGSRSNVVVGMSEFDNASLTITNCTSNNSLGCGYTRGVPTSGPATNVITGTQTGTGNTSGNSCSFN